MNKKILITLSTTISVLLALFNVDSIIIQPKEVIGIIYTILGLSLTSYTFIFSPIKELVKNNKSDSTFNNLRKIMSEMRQDMKFLFFSPLILIMIDIIMNVDFSFVLDPSLDFGIYKIVSLKSFVFNTLSYIISIFSFLSIYDIIKSTFAIVEGTIEIAIKDNKK